MKKIILALVAIFAVTASYAQVSWDARIGANVSGFSEGSQKMKLAMKAGVNMDYSFSRLFSLRPGLFFSMKGASANDKFQFFSGGDTWNISYIELPVMASFHFPISGNFSLVANGGGYAAVRISQNDKSIGDLSAMDAGVDASLDLVFNRFVMGAEVQYGLMDVVKNTKIHNLNYSLTFGYKF